MEHILAVPLMSRTLNPDTLPVYLKNLKAIAVQRVWIAVERDTLFVPDRETLDNAARAMAFFRENGLEVGIWIQALGFGDPYNETTRKIAGDWTHLTSVNGRTIDGDAFCPEDPRFMEAYCKWIRDVAALNPTLIMLDDDHCLSVRPGLGCFCPLHRKLLEEKLGEPLPEDGLDKLFFTGPGNRYRDAWLDVMRGTHIRFCQTVRRTVDEIDPAIRVGLASGYSSWDIEGADAMEISKALAGNTKPFLRLTGAPYWASEDHPRFRGFHLNAYIEIARAQESWCRDSGIEIFDENDSYPRPSYHTPTSLVECFDLALRANGNIGSLKYVMDYYSTPEYETAYLRRHLRNMPFYAWIKQHFDGKTCGGVKLYRDMRTVRTANLPDPMISEGNVMLRLFSAAAALLSQQSIPVSYEPGVPDCGIAFGEDAKSIDILPKKLILDLPAALCLQKRGMDVGISAWEATPVPMFEEYLKPWEKNYITILGADNRGAPTFFDAVLKPCAKLHSQFRSINGKLTPASYTYESNGTQFLVLMLDAETVNPSCTVFRSYRRQQQLLDFVQGDFPTIRNAPGIYTLYKTDGQETAVLFENLSLDPLFDFSIELGKPCRSVELFGAEGHLDGNRVRITSELAPYGTIGLVLREV